MRLLRAGQLPASLRPWAARIAVLGLAAAAAGCAASHGQSAASYRGHHPYPGTVVYSSPATPPPARRRVEMEEDGMEAQPPPVRRYKPEMDDPSQPWSPNYGTRSPVRKAGPQVPHAFTADAASGPPRRDNR